VCIPRLRKSQGIQGCTPSLLELLQVGEVHAQALLAGLSLEQNLDELGVALLTYAGLLQSRE
jgi:hypothetical protein